MGRNGGRGEFVSIYPYRYVSVYVYRCIHNMCVCVYIMCVCVDVYSHESNRRSWLQDTLKRKPVDFAWNWRFFYLPGACSPFFG